MEDLGKLNNEIFVEYKVRGFPVTSSGDSVIELLRGFPPASSPNTLHVRRLPQDEQRVGWLDAVGRPLGYVTFL